MRRILFLLSRFLDGGIDMVLVDYLRQLASCADYEIALAISTKMDELEVFAGAIPPNVKVCHLVSQPLLTRWRKEKIVSHLPLHVKLFDELLLSPVRRAIISRRLHALASQYDVVIDFDCCHYSYLADIPVKKIAWYHFSFQHMMEHHARHTRRIGKRLACYDHIVVISRAMQEEGEALFPWLAGKWCLIYNAKDEQLLAQKAAAPVANSLINQPYILAIERLEESQKDLTTLLHAYHLLKQQHTVKEKLYLLGKGRDEGMLRQLASRLGIDNDVCFLGFESNPYPWIRHAALIAHSAKMEGLPTVLIESLVMGKLIVSTDCPTGPREILDDGKAGLLTPVGDAPALANAMYRLLSDPALQQDVLRHAARHKDNFLFTTTLQRFKELL